MIYINDGDYDIIVYGIGSSWQTFLVLCDRGGFLKKNMGDTDYRNAPILSYIFKYAFPPHLDIT